MNEEYLQPVWDEYNRGLLRLGEKGRTRGVVIATGAGHFIQRDNPQCVVDEIVKLIGKVKKEEESEQLEGRGNDNYR